MSQLKSLNNILKSKGTLRATLVLSFKMILLRPQNAASIAGKTISLQPQLSSRSHLTADGSLSSHPPQLHDLSLVPSQSGSATEACEELYSTSSTQADIEYTAVPKPATNSKPTRRPSPMRNFSLPTSHSIQPRKVARYYASALTPNEKTALAEGQENHNLKSWTAKDLSIHKEALKDLKSIISYTGSDEQVCIIPVIIVTDGQNARTHKQQLYQKLDKSHVANVPAVQQNGNVLIAQERTQALAPSRTASNGSYFTTNHRPVSYQPSYPSASASVTRVRSPLANEISLYQPRKDVTFDSILVPHRSGKGETYRDEQDARAKNSKKTTGI